jgi:hypothetical protein
MPNARRLIRLSSRTAFVLLLLPFISRADSPPPRKYWVYFIDKGLASRDLRPTASGLPHITGRALRRRSKVLPADELVDMQDVPVAREYVKAVRDAGGVPARESRWLNAASFYLRPDLIERVSRLPFVARVSPVAAFHFRNEPGPRPAAPSRAAPFSTLIEYGESFTQISTIDVPPLHQIGVTGRGVLVGMLDSGFRWRVHEALRTRHVIAEHDFIFNDDTTANQPGDDPGQDVHGTLTMSVLGGYAPGILIGPAFDADFILGKTEDIRSETEVEEDNWAAGIEWMEGRGADVVSSSLGYNIFDDGNGYTWANGDFNGRTSVTAKAAARAARLGVVVCDAMGNERNGDGVTGTMLTPADADSIVSVGAVTYGGVLAGFSSTGPTNDGRTKPDVAAPGVLVLCALVPDSYGYQQGTSLATPLAAGSAALVLSARPELTPLQVRDALRNSARPLTDSVRFPSSPNNFTGWGLVDAFKAALSFGPVFGYSPAVSVEDSGSVVTALVVSSKGLRSDGVVLHYTAGTNTISSSVTMSLDSSMFYATSGRYRARIPLQERGTLVGFSIEASDSAGNSYKSPPASAGTVWHLRYGLPGVSKDPLIPHSFSLAQNYPNPFNERTIIEYDLAAAEKVTIRVYDALGREVASFDEGYRQAGYSHTVAFDARDLASGVYYYRLTTPAQSATRKMLLIR